MIIELCPKGHKYDAGYFTECPHCLKENKANSKEEKSTKTIKTAWNNPSESRKRNHTPKNPVLSSTHLDQEIKAATDSIIQSDSRKQTSSKSADASNKKEKTEAVPKIINYDLSNLKQYILMASMPEKLIKNQNFCIDLGLFEIEKWRDGADMLSFKLRNAARDIKTISIPTDSHCKISISYKDDLLLEKNFSLCNITNRIMTYPVTITDTRDRKTHMLKIRFSNEETCLNEILLLQPIG